MFGVLPTIVVDTKTCENYASYSLEDAAQGPSRQLERHGLRDQKHICQNQALKSKAPSITLLSLFDQLCLVCKSPPCSIHNLTTRLVIRSSGRSLVSKYRSFTAPKQIPSTRSGAAEQLHHCCSFSSAPLLQQQLLPHSNVTGTGHPRGGVLCCPPHSRGWEPSQLGKHFCSTRVLMVVLSEF